MPEKSEGPEAEEIDNGYFAVVGGIFIITHKGTKFLSHYKSIGYKLS
jgi:hypothetical protein